MTLLKAPNRGSSRAVPVRRSWDHVGRSWQTTRATAFPFPQSAQSDVADFEIRLRKRESREEIKERQEGKTIRDPEKTPRI